MRHTQLLCAIGISLWATTTAGSQAPNSPALPADLRAHVQTDRFGIVSAIRGLPLGVRDELQTLFGGRLDIAEPGERFQSSDVVTMPNLPIRRLALGGCSMDHCLVYYQRGGIAYSWRVAIFHWTPEATRFEWGGTAPAGLTTVDEVRNAILSGAIKSSRAW